MTGNLLSFLPRYEAPCIALDSAEVELSGLSREERKSIVKAAATLEHPWLGYAATPVVMSFHQAQETHRFIRAASQAGKTMGCAREAWMYAGDFHPFRTVPRCSGLGLIAVGALEGTPLKGVLTALWNTRPDHLIDWEQTKWTGPHHAPPNLTIFMKNGSVIKIVSSRGGSTGAASVQADWVWIDEPPKKDKFSELIARTTQTDGHVWLSFTPFDSQQDLRWLQLYLEGDEEKGTPPEAPGWGKFTMELSVRNCPWMTQERVDAVWANTPKWIAEQRLKGGWSSPPTDGYFTMDASQHGYGVEWPSNEKHGAWIGVAMADHGELAAHEHVIFALIRKAKRADKTCYAQVMVVTEYVSGSRTSIQQDADGIRAALKDAAQLLGDDRWADPNQYRWIGDINSAGKGLAGRTVNEALAEALGMRRDKIESAVKSPGSIEDGLVKLRAAIDARPTQIRVKIAPSFESPACAPRLWHALCHHKGVEDSTKHAIDAFRYGVVPYLTVGSSAFRGLPEPRETPQFSTTNFLE